MSNPIWDARFARIERRLVIIDALLAVNLVASAIFVVKLYLE